MTQRRNTHQRALVYEAVAELVGTHPTAAQVYDYVHERDPKVSLATVYRNLNLLADEGAILAIETAEGRHYDHRTDDHGHVVCARCGAMEDIALPEDEGLDRTVERLSGYAGVHHRTVYEGLCPACAKAASQKRPA